MKKPKKPWSPTPYIKSHLRKIWRWSPQRRQCLKAKTCIQCLKRKSKLFADHIDPVVDPLHGFVDWNTYITRLFDGALQPLCEACHKVKSKLENSIRRRVKKERISRVD